MTLNASPWGWGGGGGEGVGGGGGEGGGGNNVIIRHMSVFLKCNIWANVLLVFIGLHACPLCVYAVLYTSL